MAKERNETIDVLRGVSLLAVIFIHCLAYYLSGNVAQTLWNYSQFAVQVFVFCSGYLFFKKFIGSNTPPSFNYLFSRIKRLLVPYYIFLVTFIPIIYLTQPKKITFTFLLENILVKDGIDINWLVLLFIQFAALSVVLFFIMRKSKLLFYLYLVGALLMSIGLMITHFGGNYKLVMWFPWSLVLIYGYYFVLYEKNKIFLYATTVFFGAIYAFTLFTQALTHHSLVFFDNKYPPNLYYLSYGLFMLNVAIIIIQTGIFKSQVATRTISFFSKYSYSFFFVHYAVIYIVSTHYAYTRLHWSVFFVMILTISILVQGIINNIRS